MDVDAGSDSLVAVIHHRAGQIAEPRPVQIDIDDEDGAAAGDTARHPGRWKKLAEQLNRAGVDLVTDKETRPALNLATVTDAGISVCRSLGRAATP